MEGDLDNLVLDLGDERNSDRVCHLLETIIFPQGHTPPIPPDIPIYPHDVGNSGSPIRSRPFHPPAQSGEGVCLRDQALWKQVSGRAWAERHGMWGEFCTVKRAWVHTWPDWRMMGKGLMNLGLSFLQGSLSRMSLVKSHTFCPRWKVGVVARRTSTWCLLCRTALLRF